MELIAYMCCYSYKLSGIKESVGGRRETESVIGKVCVFKWENKGHEMTIKG